VLKFGSGAVFNTGTTVGASVPRPVGKTALGLALEVDGLTFPVVGGLRLVPGGLGSKLELVVFGVVLKV
jgi:hypothetical protein